MEIPVYEAEESPCRAYVIQRRTKETRISVDLCLEGGEIRISTGIGFFDHMLTAFAFYGGLGLKIEAEGDLEVDGHHTVEDTGIVLGQALNRALGIGRGSAASPPPVSQWTRPCASRFWTFLTGPSWSLTLICLSL